MPGSTSRALEASLDKIDANLHLAGFPHVSEPQGWTLTVDGGWTGGFWVGLLWAAFEERGEGRYIDKARELMALLGPRASETTNHDLGMLFCPSFVKAWRVTTERHYRDVAHQAARTLAGQFNERAGLLPGWGFFGTEDWRGRALVDTLMNLPLLAWADTSLGDRRCGEVARRHARTSLRSHLRPDGSTYHVFRFDSATGEALGGDTYQGARPESCWARGQSWAIAGLASLAAEWEDETLRSAASAAAEYYLAHLPEDMVPYWDFDAAGPRAPKDSSAAAIAAYGLLRLVEMGEDKYAAAAQATVESLVAAYMGGPEAPGILVHATADLPHGLGIDGCTIYGDYFFVHSLRVLEAGAGRSSAGSGEGGEPTAQRGAC